MDDSRSLAGRILSSGFRRVFVTGASGFIGRELSVRLASAGIEVLGLYRNPKAKPFLVDGGVRAIRGDITRPEQWSSHLEDCDALFHMAALAAPWHPEPDMFYRLNFEAAKDVFHLAADRGIRRIVFTSTAGTMGYREHVSEPLLNETSFTSPPLETRYEDSKFKAEQYAREMHRTGEADIVIVNPSRVFGPGMISDSNAITKLIDWYIKGIWRIIPGDGKSIGNYVFIEDVVQGHLLALLHGNGGERYIIGGENSDFHRLFEIIGEETGRDRWMFTLPVPVMLAVAKGEEWRAKYVGGKPLISVPFAKKYVRHFPLSTDKAKEELNYQPNSLRESIRKTVNWVKKQS